MNFTNSSNPNNLKRQVKNPRKLNSRLRFTKGSPAAKAWGVLRDLCIQDFPIDPRHIATELGIVLWERELPNACDGCLMQVGKVSGILINARIRSEVRKKFTIAHEIGHYMLERDSTRFYSLDERPNRMMAGKEEERSQNRAYLLSEQRANQFAVELLMPSPIFLVDSSALPQIGLPAIAELASQYGTSMTSTALHYTRLSDHVCAIVFSEAGVIRYFAYSNGFRENKDCYLVSGQPLHPDALASQFSKVTRFSEVIDDVPLNYWCRPKNKGSDGRIIEHSRRIPRTNKVITFLHLP